METIDTSVIQEKAQELIEILEATVVENDKVLTFTKDDIHLCDVVHNDDFVFFSINVGTNKDYYEDVHSFIFNVWIPELIGCHEEIVKNKIVYHDMDELEEATIKSHKVEYNYGFNFITFKVYKKEK
jgi:hypothetical protein